MPRNRLHHGVHCSVQCLQQGIGIARLTSQTAAADTKLLVLQHSHASLATPAEVTTTVLNVKKKLYSGEVRVWLQQQVRGWPAQRAPM